ncbi:NAD(P)/FAD-dependent oxidoreductase [Candidatus Micrarchaeota archaeon]|nr:NAD(P)/FAD-dependent oxidoreductase [Candidatus Micrarchaeota archaeon]
MTAKYDHDAIVIGGGPAGSSFARVAAGAGMDVLVVDKRKEIGVPVRCGEGLGSMDMLKQGLGLPRACYSTEIEGAKVYAPNGKSITWKGKDTGGWVLERKFFDKWLCELAVEKGAKVHTYTRAAGVIKDAKGRPQGVRLSHGGKEPYDVSAPLIVSAEGMESMIARELGFKTVHSLYDVDTCYEYEMKPYDHENLIEIFFGNKAAPRGYVWIFPKADKKANVGIGIGGMVQNGKKQGGLMGADPKPLLDDFVKKNARLKDASTLLDFGGVISVGAPIDEFVKDGCMVVGTAAKQVDPIHGGGIGLAIDGGVMAAGTAIKAHEKKDYSKAVLMEYDSIWRKEKGPALSNHLKLRKVLEKVSDDDLNHVIGALAKEDLDKVMAGDFAKVAAKVLAGRPQMIGVLRGLAP